MIFSFHLAGVVFFSLQGETGAMGLPGLEGLPGSKVSSRKVPVMIHKENRTESMNAPQRKGRNYICQTYVYMKEILFQVNVKSLE